MRKDSLIRAIDSGKVMRQTILKIGLAKNGKNMPNRSTIGKAAILRITALEIKVTIDSRRDITITIVKENRGISNIKIGQLTKTINKRVDKVNSILR